MILSQIFDLWTFVSERFCGGSYSYISLLIIAICLFNTFYDIIYDFIYYFI